MAPSSSLNSTPPKGSQTVGGVYNVTPPAPVDGQGVALQVDSSGNLKTTGIGPSTVKIEDTSGNALNSNGSGALNVAVVSGGGANASVGATGSTAPTSATEIGIIDNSGNLQGASSTNPVRTDPTGTTIQPVSGTVTANPGTGTFATQLSGSTGSQWTWSQATTPGTRQTLLSNSNAYATLSVVGVVNSGTGSIVVIFWGSNDGSNWVPLYEGIRSGSNTSGFPAYTGVTTITPGTGISFGASQNISALVNISGYSYISATMASAIGTINITFTPNAHSSSTSMAVPNPSIVTTITSLADNAASARPVFDPNSTLGILGVANFAVVSTQGTGATGSGWAGLRTPTTFKTLSATAAGNTAVWTPASGKKFRLMRYQIELTESATLASAATITVGFQDATTAFGFQHDVLVPASAGTTAGAAYRSGWIDMGNGYQSTTANNALNFNIGGGNNLTAGNFRVNVCGTEE